MPTSATTTTASATVPPPQTAPAAPTDGRKEDTPDWSNEDTLKRSLAQLYAMQAQIQQMRTLIPHRLLSPLRAITSPPRDPAIAYSSPPSIPSPETLYGAMLESFKEGQDEINRLRTTWDDTQTRKLRTRATERRNNDPRGYVPAVPDDVDLGMNDMLDGVLQFDDLGNVVKRNANPIEKAAEVDDHADVQMSGMDSQEEDFLTIVDRFHAEKPKIFVKTIRHDGKDGMVRMRMMGLKWLILRGEKGSKNEGAWVVKPEEKVRSLLHAAMKEAFDGRPSDRRGDLRFLLDMVASYENAKGAPCTKCGQLIDSKPQLPYLRIPHVVTEMIDGIEKTVNKFEARHESCGVE